MEKQPKKKRRIKEVLIGEKFDAMTDEQRAEVIAEIEAETPQQRMARSRPLNAEERGWWREVQKKSKAGRPKLGKSGTRNISITVEKALLKRIDTYAKAKGIKRSELFSRSAAELIGETA
jgi:hypothetical protein